MNRNGIIPEIKSNILILFSAIFIIAFPAACLDAGEDNINVASVTNIAQYNISRRSTADPPKKNPFSSAPSSDDDYSFMPDGIDAVSCSIFGNIPVIVEGPTTLEFWWRGSNAGIMSFILNGKVQSVQYRDNGWQKYKLILSEKGTHHLKWVYTASEEKYASITP
jgi:hypothetical protein